MLVMTTSIGALRLPEPVDVGDFIRWASGREGRYELAGGKIRMMAGASRAHAVIALRLGSRLSNSLDPDVILGDERRLRRADRRILGVGLDLGAIYRGIGQGSET
jgi:hypothetical protein